MKKIIALLIVCLMVVPFGMLASTSVSAADNVIYIKAGGTGDGSAQSKPIGTVQAAFDKVVASGKDTTFVLIGDVPMDITPTYGFYCPEYQGKVTITGKYGSVDGGRLVISADDQQNWVLGGDLEFNNVEIAMSDSSPKPNIVFRCHFHHFTFGENVISPAGTYIVGGVCDAKPANHPDTEGGTVAIKDTYSFDEATTTFTGDVNITLKSGTVNEIGIIVRGGATLDSYHKGVANLTISGTATVSKIAGVRNTGRMITGDINIYLDGGIVNNFICHNHRQSYDNGKTGVNTDAKYTVIITKNFDFSQSFNAAAGSGFFQGIAGSTLATASGEVMLADELYGEYRLFAEASKWDEMVASNKIFVESFDRINKVEDGKGLSVNEKTATPEKSDLEVSVPEPPAPDTDAGTKAPTTSKPSNSQTTTKDTSKVTNKADVTTAAPAGDASQGGFPIWIVAVVAGVVVAIVVVVIVVAKKKKAE